MEAVDVDTREETLRLALESVLRWTDKSFEIDPSAPSEGAYFRDAMIVRAIAKVAEVALESKP